MTLDIYDEAFINTIRNIIADDQVVDNDDWDKFTYQVSRDSYTMVHFLSDPNLRVRYIVAREISGAIEETLLYAYRTRDLSRLQKLDEMYDAYIDKHPPNPHTIFRDMVRQLRPEEIDRVFEAQIQRMLPHYM